MKNIRDKILAAFQIEYMEHLEYIRSALAEAGSGTGNNSRELLNESFRRAHSLKGAARAADMRPVEDLAHRMETIYSRLRDGTIKMDATAIGVINRVADAIEDWVVSFSKGSSPPPPVEEMQAIERFIGMDSDVEESESARPTDEVTAEPEGQEIRPIADMDGTVRVATANLDRLLSSAGQLLSENVQQEKVVRLLRSIGRDFGDFEKEWFLLRKSFHLLPQSLSREPLGKAFLRHVDSIDQIIQAMAKEQAAVRILQQRSAWMLGQLGDELQDRLRLTRMIPVQNVYGDFRKMIRDLARDEGKEIEFSITGMDIRADRMVLQALKDPVMHMLRNAVFHGIEAPGERAEKKKNATGRISLTFRVSGGQLAIEVDDDGHGIDIEKIVKTGISKGYMTRQEAEDATQTNLLHNIFRPGFSTSETITDLAGRGLGLSIVYDAVARLNGSVNAVEKKEPGAAFRLLVPLSVSTHRLLMVVSCGQAYGIPTDGIDRLYRVKADGVMTVEGKPVINHQGRQVGLFGLAEIIGLETTEINVSEGIMTVLILRSGGVMVAVAVDSMLGIRDAVVKDIGFPMGKRSVVSGGIILEDGSVSPVLSPFVIVEKVRLSNLSHDLTTVEKTPEKKLPVILVVDDSMTTRTLEKSILEAHGYRVCMAVDGIEALTKLQSERIDLIVSDIQMPRLDGFGMLKEIKKNPKLAKIPVIMVTSMSRQEDRKRGLALGADAYVVKQKFDQRDLLETIEQML